MKQLRLYFYLLLVAAGMLTIAACDDDEPEARKPVVLVVNEGQFLAGNGSLSSFDPDSKVHTGDVFASANAGRSLSANVQSVTVADDEIYVVCNQADKIEWLGDDFTAKRAELKNADLVTPRYLAVSGNRAFVSVWGPYTLPSYDLEASKVAVINRSTFAIEQWIAVPAGPEGIVATGGKVFAACSFTDTVVVINASTLAVEKKIKTHSGPSRLVVDKDGQVWAVCTGQEALQRINVSTLAIDRTVSFSGKGLTGKVAMNAAKDRFFLLGNEAWPGKKGFVYSFALSATEAPSAALIEGENFYGIGVDPQTGTLYVGNSNSFQGEGTVLRYNANGSTLDNFPAGIGPNGFVFF